MTHPPYRQYTLRDGLPQMQVTCLFQDSRGYLWAGTKGGLSCFNGEKFVNFTRGKELIDDYITDLEEDEMGNVWMGTNSGLARFDGKEITFFPSGLSQRLIGMKIAPTTDGQVWYMGWISDRPSVFGTFENGIFTDKKIAPIPSSRHRSNQGYGLVRKGQRSTSLFPAPSL